MIQLWLIRHGESAFNAVNRIQGHHDAPLSPFGHEQARRLARRLALDPPDAIYSSDLSRARDTARAIAEACHLTTRSDYRLREFDLGTWTNLTWEELRLGYPDEWDLFTKGDPDFPRGGAESTLDVQQRVQEISDEIVAAHASQRVAIVSHGGALRVLLGYLLALSPVQAQRGFQLDNTSLTIVEPAEVGGAGRLLRLNDTAHLEEWAAL